MKQLSTYINEKLVLNKDTFKVSYNYFPKTVEELRKILKQLIKARGKDADLNDINVSGINNMMYSAPYTNGLFDGLNPRNIDISSWDVSNVENMNRMFWNCENLNCDLSSWNVSKVTSMANMFYHCEKFNCDLSRWDVSEVTNMKYMFYCCRKFNCDLSKWNVSKVENMESMFEYCEYFKGQGLQNWKLISVKNITYMFHKCALLNCDLSNWDISNIPEKLYVFKGTYLKEEYKPINK